ncbi:MAG: hypothetical protein LBE12_17240 [Planctomycetaceae bacterium]|nr:hypothetical protein [Planctomycetaceae bacterium]
MSQAIYKYSRLKSACGTLHSPLSTLHFQLSTFNYPLSTIISLLQGFGKGESSCSGGCASLHRRLCISHP